MRRLRDLFLLALVLAASCKPDGDKVASKGAKDASEERPTDESEGLPGYLVDAGRIAVEAAGSGFLLKGPAGTVGSRAGAPSSIEVVAYETTLANLFDALAKGSNAGSIAVEERGRATAAADGSLELQVKAFDDGILLLSAGLFASKGQLKLPLDVDEDQPPLVFKDPRSKSGFTPVPKPNAARRNHIQCSGSAPAFDFRGSRVQEGPPVALATTLSLIALHVKGTAEGEYLAALTTEGRIWGRYIMDYEDGSSNARGTLLASGGTLRFLERTTERGKLEITFDRTTKVGLEEAPAGTGQLTWDGNTAAVRLGCMSDSREPAAP